MSSNLFSAWSAFVKRRPVVVNSLTGASLCAASDALAQYLEVQRLLATASLEPDDDTLDQSHQHQHHRVDMASRFRRILSAAAIGAFFGGFVYPKAYAKLDAMWHGTHFSAVLQKSLVEIATVGIFVNSISMSCRGLLMGRDVDPVMRHVASELPTVTVNDARVWLPYNMLAFSVIPAVLRPTTTLMMEATWQTYISLVSNKYQYQSSVSSSPMNHGTAAAASISRVELVA